MNLSYTARVSRTEVEESKTYKGEVTTKYKYTFHNLPVPGGESFYMVIETLNPIPYTIGDLVTVTIEKEHD